LKLSEILEVENIPKGITGAIGLARKKIRANTFVIKT
jgi:hypothetical protein